LVSRLIPLTFLTTHLMNHALGLISLARMEAGRTWFLSLGRNPLGTLALYGALGAHIGLAFWALYQRRHLRMPAWEAAQLFLGLAVLLPALALLGFAQAGRELAIPARQPDWVADVLQATRAPAPAERARPATASARNGFARPARVAGRERDIAVLFADLRRFTQLAEHQLPYDMELPSI
jgi:hypothetical protein